MYNRNPLPFRTVDERLVVYREIKTLIEKGECDYFCEALGDLCNVSRYDGVLLFPELLAYKPEGVTIARNTSAPWFGTSDASSRKRIKILDLTISDCMRSIQDEIVGSRS